MNTNLTNIGRENRNPLNIRYSSSNHWLGLHPAMPCRRGFCRFTADAYGYRAAVVLIKNYIRLRGLDTPRAIISRWAPPAENPTQLYIAAVCGRSRLDADEHLPVDGLPLCRLIAAMARQECGAVITPEAVLDIRRRFGV